jgi:thiamine kinase-like enzyme
MNQIRRASDSNAEFDSQTDSASVYAKAEVRAGTPRGLPVSGSVAAGAEGRMTWQDGNRQESSVNYDKTYQDVAKILQEARNSKDSEDSEQNAYDSIKDYYGDIIELAPSEKAEPKSNEKEPIQEAISKDEPYNNRGGRHEGWVKEEK